VERTLLGRDAVRSKRRKPVAHETAGQHLTTRVATCSAQDTAANMLSSLKAAEPDFTDAVYVVDERHRPLGVVALRDLLRAGPAVPASSLMTSTRPVGVDTDQEVAATRALADQATAVPVVDDDGRLVGVVPPQRLLQILRHEHVEDLHRLAGVSRETRQARAALEEPPARRVRHRLPWLLVGLVGSTLATLIVARYERILEARIAVAFFVPGIVYLADAIGTQTEAIAVRGLSLTMLRPSRVIWGELRAGALVGLLLGSVAFGAVVAALHDGRLAATVGITVFVAGAAASAVGVGFPVLLARLGRDPALGSGPLATVVQDILTLLVYFVVGSLVL
jgi:magnesium transporter